MGSVALTLGSKIYVYAYSWRAPLFFQNLDPPREFECLWKSTCSEGVLAQSLRVRDYVASFANASIHERAICVVVAVFGISRNAVDGYRVHDHTLPRWRRSWLGEVGSQAKRSGIDCAPLSIVRLRHGHASPRAHRSVLEVLMMFAVQAWSSPESAWGHDAS